MVHDMKQKKISKAYPALLQICEYKLPINKARAVYRMMNLMREHFEFALSEEKKSIVEYGGKVNQDGTISFDKQENFGMFCDRMTEINESEIEWSEPPIVLTESEIGNQSISVSDIRSLEGFIIFE